MALPITKWLAYIRAQVAADTYEAVLVYAPHWHDDVARLVRHARPEVGTRILLIERADRLEARSR